MEHEDRRDWMRNFSVGMEFTITFLSGLFLGMWLDKLHGPAPAYMLTFGAIGFGIALYRLIRQALEIKRADAERQQNKKNQIDSEKNSGKDSEIEQKDKTQQ